MFHDPKSAWQKGTLANIRICYGHKNVLQNTKNCFNATHELIEFTTSAYIIGAALMVMGISDINTPPPDLPTTKKDKLLFLNSVAQKVSIVLL